MSLLAKTLQTMHRKDLRGASWLLRLVVDRMKLLRDVPIQIADWPPIFMDLREPNSLFWFINSPLADSYREVDEQTIMRRVIKEHDIVFDIGANIGLHAALLSRLVGPSGLVVAFEPNPAVLRPLRKTIAAMGNARLFPFALSDRACESVLYLADDTSEVASLGDWTEGAYGETHQTTCEERRLDDLIESGVIPHPNFVKCDVEGAELAVFRGAVNVLDRIDAPIILFEANAYTAKGFGVGMWDAVTFLTGLVRPRYSFLEVRGGNVQSREGACHTVSVNILAVPSCKGGDFPELNGNGDVHVHLKPLVML
jgi:FkbM family methyltransferase